MPISGTTNGRNASSARNAACGARTTAKGGAHRARPDASSGPSAPIDNPIRRTRALCARRKRSPRGGAARPIAIAGATRKAGLCGANARPALRESRRRRHRAAWGSVARAPRSSRMSALTSAAGTSPTARGAGSWSRGSLRIPPAPCGRGARPAPRLGREPSARGSRDRLAARTTCCAARACASKASRRARAATGVSAALVPSASSGAARPTPAHGPRHERPGRREPRTTLSGRGQRPMGAIARMMPRARRVTIVPRREDRPVRAAMGASAGLVPTDSSGRKVPAPTAPRRERPGESARNGTRSGWPRLVGPPLGTAPRAGRMRTARHGIATTTGRRAARAPSGLIAAKARIVLPARPVPSGRAKSGRPVRAALPARTGRQGKGQAASSRAARDPRARERKASSRAARDPRAHERKASSRVARDPRAHERKASSRVARGPREHEQKASSRVARDPRAHERTASNRAARDPRARERKASSRVARGPREHEQKASSRVARDPRAHERAASSRAARDPKARGQAASAPTARMDSAKAALTRIAPARARAARDLTERIGAARRLREGRPGSLAHSGHSPAVAREAINRA